MMDSKEVRNAGRKKKEEEFFPLKDQIIIDNTFGVDPEAHFMILWKYEYYVRLLWEIGGYAFKSQLIYLSPKSKSATKLDIKEMIGLGILKEDKRKDNAPVLLLGTQGIRFATRNVNYNNVKSPQYDSLVKNAYIMDYFLKYHNGNLENSLIGRSKADKVAEIFKLENYEIGKEILDKVKEAEQEMSQGIEGIKNAKKKLKTIDKIIEDEKITREDLIYKRRDLRMNQNTELERIRKLKDKIDLIRERTINYRALIKKMEKEYKLALEGEDIFTKLKKSHIYLDSINGNTLKFVILDLDRPQKWFFSNLIRIDKLFRDINNHIRFGDGVQENNLELFNYEIFVLTRSKEREDIIKSYAESFLKNFKKNKETIQLASTYETSDGELIIAKKSITKKQKEALVKKTAFYLQNITVGWTNIDRFYRTETKNISFLDNKENIMDSIQEIVNKILSDKDS